MRTTKFQREGLREVKDEDSLVSWAVMCSVLDDIDWQAGMLERAKNISPGYAVGWSKWLADLEKGSR